MQTLFTKKQSQNNLNRVNCRILINCDVCKFVILQIVYMYYIALLLDTILLKF